jgi:soluble lytic murein transglycosylase
MSILSALKETQRDNNNLEDLAKLPQALIMQMAQNGQIPKDMVMPILGKKAEMAESTAKMNAAKQIAAQGGAQPTIMEQYMGQIAQAENPAPPMPQQQMQQPMPQQMAQQPMPQGPEDVGIASQATQPMQMAGGGIVAFGPGGDVDIDPDDDYQDMLDQAEEDSMNEEIYGLINQMNESVGRGERAAVGIRSGENKNVKEDTRERAKGEDLESRLRAVIMQRESGGRDYDQKGNPLTSSKGAKYAMQVLDSTARDPGFGIKPAKDISAPEYNRVGNEYIGALLNKYQDPKLTMIAYNYGPGATDKWLAAGADINKLPKETQKYISGVNLAGGGEVKHYAGGGTMDGFSDAFDEREEEVYYDPYFAEGTASGYSRKAPRSQVDPKTIIKKPSASKKTDPAKTAATVVPGIPDELKNAQIAPPQNKPPTADVTPREKAEEETFNLMQYIREQQANRKKASADDKNMALLAAGLGMLGGTSQYAFENIGKGGQMGVQQLANSQRLRASQDIADSKLLGTAANIQQRDKYNRLALAQNKELKQDKMAQDLITNRNSYIQKRMKDYNMDEMMLGNLRRQQAKGKLTDPDKLADLEFYEQQIKNIEREANRRFPSSGTSGVIKLD